MQSATSTLDEFKPGTSFKQVIDDEFAAKNPQKFVKNKMLHKLLNDIVY